MPQSSLAGADRAASFNICIAKGCKMYQALYRSFRPEKFDDLLGQEHIVRILQNQIAAGTTGHAYLFCGTRGTGKTTTARLLAKALNCTSEGSRPCGECEACKAIAAGNFLDVIEIDAASNNGVDDIRDLRESVNFPPVLGRTKVYIIDEAHMLTGPAANALLKTLEEPPQNVVFILATTEPSKLPATILSRCLRMDFRRIPEEQLIRRFSEICVRLNVEASPEALALIAVNADGSARDGLSLLDRCISGVNRLTRDDVLFLLGMAGTETFLEITDDVLRGDCGAALTCFARILAEGKEAAQFARDWVEHLRNLIIIKYAKQPENLLNLSIENIRRLKEQCERTDTAALRFWITELSKALADAKWSARPRILIELAIVRMVEGEEPAPVAQIRKKPADSDKAEPRKSAYTVAAEPRKSGRPEKVAAVQNRDPEKAPAVAPKASAGQNAEPRPQASELSSFGEAEEMSAAEMAELREAMAAPSVEVLTEEEENDALWNAVLHDASVSIQLQMSGAVLESMDENSFTIRVSNVILSDRFYANASSFENLMEIRSGVKRKMKVIV